MILEVANAEVLDKLSVLDIKAQRMTDETKLKFVKEERELVLKQGAEALLSNASCGFWFRQLVNINTQIWDKLAELDEIIPKMTQEHIVQLANLAVHIQTLNNHRARVKQKLSVITLSEIVEQKSYATRKLHLVTHTGMGDYVTMVGLLNALSVQWDKVTLAGNAALADLMRHNHNVQIIIDQDMEAVATAQSAAGYTVQLLGLYHPNFKGWVNTFFDQFYLDAGVNPSARIDMFHISRDKAKEIEFAERVFPGFQTREYAFVHDKITLPHKRCETIAPALLPTHLPIFHPGKCSETALLGLYCKLLESAQEIHMLDSSFSCLAVYLKLKAKRKVIYVRTVGDGHDAHPAWIEMAKRMYAGWDWEVVPLTLKDQTE